MLFKDDDDEEVDGDVIEDEELAMTGQSITDLLSDLNCEGILFVQKCNF